MSWLKLGILTLSLVLPSALIGVAHAEPTTQELELARRHYNAGQEFYRAGKFDQAAEEFEAAYQISKKPAFLFNMGQCYARLGKRKDAAYTYRRYLEEAPDAVDAPSVRTLVEALEKEEKAGPTETKVVLVQAPAPAAPPPHTPVYKQWWLWTAVGVVAAGVAVGVGVGVTLSKDPFNPAIGPLGPGALRVMP